MTGTLPTYTQLAGRVLGLPFVDGGRSPREGFDCAGVALWVLRELGFDPPEGCMDGDGGACWVYVGDRYLDATEPGDVIVSDPSGYCEGDSQCTPPSPHVTVLVDPRARMCLTAHEGGGVIGMKAHLVSNLLRVVRLK